MRVTAEEYKLLLLGTWGEKEFQAEFLKLAKVHGWRSAHFRPGRTGDGGWRTAVAGDGTGFPDNILLRAERLIVAELKVATKPKPEQLLWLAAWRLIPAAEVYVWKPADWPEIIQTLTRS